MEALITRDSSTTSEKSWSYRLEDDRLHFYEFNLSYAAAVLSEDFCIKRGDNMASVQSQEEQNKMRQLACVPI